MGCDPLVLVELHLSGFVSIFVTEKNKCKVNWSMYKFRSSETYAYHLIRCCLQIGFTYWNFILPYSWTGVQRSTNTVLAST